MTPQPAQNADPFGLGALTPQRPQPQQSAPQQPAPAPPAHEASPWDTGSNPEQPGFWSSAASSAWNAIKSPVDAVVDAFTPHSLASRQQHARDVANRVADTELSGTPEQKSQLHQEMLQSVPFGSTVSKVQQGNYRGAAGDVVGGLAGAAVLGGAVAGAGKLMPGNVTPDIALWQAVPMRTSAADYLEAGPAVRGDIKRAATVTNPGATNPLNDVPSVKNAVAMAKAENRAALDTHLNPYRSAGVTMPGNAIADAIDSTIPTSLQVEAKMDPAAAQRIQQIRQVAQAYRQHQFTVDELRNLAIETNGELNGFFHKTADAQNASLAQQGGVAVLQAKAAAIRDMMRQYFGPDAADIQRRWGWLDDVDAGLDAAHKKVLNQKPVSPADAVVNWPTSPGKAVKQAVHGDINTLLKRAFDQTEPSGPLPTAQPGQGFGGFPNAAPPARQLPAGTPQLGAPRPGSYVSNSGLPPQWQTQQWQGVNAPRQLPAGRTPIVTPPPADTSFVRGVSADPVPLAENRQLPAPGRGQPPLNVQPTGPAGTARPMPPAGTSAILDQPGRPLGLPEPSPARPQGRFIVPPQELPPPGGLPPAAGTHYQPTGESIATKLGKSVWNAVWGGQ